MDTKIFHDAVKAGDLAAIRAALEEQPSLLNAKNDAGQTAFLLAKYYRQGAAADYLLGLNPDLDLYTGCVAGRVTFVMDQIDADAKLLESHSPDGWTPLHLAGFFGHKELAKALLVRGAKVDSRSTNAMKNTPLHAAMAGRQKEMVAWLLENGANVNATQEGGWTVLHAAAQNGDREMMEYLLINGANAGARAANNQLALDLALLNGHQEVAVLLQHLHADSDQQPN